MRICLVVYDDEAYIASFPQGIAYVAAALRRAGHEVAIWAQDVQHYADEDLTAYLDANAFDVVGIGVIAGYFQYRRLLRLSKAVNRSRKRPFFVLGGYGPTPEPEFFMRKTEADAIVLGEGEAVVCELFDALEHNRPFSEVKGIAYRDGETIHVNERAPLIADIRSIPWPAYDLFEMNYYRLHRPSGVAATEFAIPVLSGRGCTFKCTFCYRMDTGHRPRPFDDLLDEIEFLQKTYRIGRFDFSDDLLMVSKQHTVEFCQEVLRRGSKFHWNCNGRLNYATPDVLKIMKEAGCVFINYGIESVDDVVLRNMKKGLRYDMIIAGIENTQASGIHPGLNIIFGNIGDNRETLKKSVDFLVKYDDQAQFRTIRPVTPYPGSPLYYDAIAKGLLSGPEEFYEVKHLNSDLVAVNFTELSDDEFHEALLEANEALIQNYYDKMTTKVIDATRELYLKHDVNFRGYRHT
ncbi:MAG: B12-binding domain-containing radical SAM protein [Alphaproteobacteria bacterium]|nr:B12-binding domain-containing radical SAM protein [Alphaproteobacteria bacterium]MBF0130335.1 B12-binding domain-containing radical SAM protein [Alphaproteobacteria bacterium]